MELSNFFFGLTTFNANYKASANWLLGPVRNYLAANETSLQEIKVLPEALARLIELVDNGKISYGIASQKVFPELIKDPGLNIHEFITENGLQTQSSQNEIEGLIAAALHKHAEKINEYKKGKKGLISLFVGEVMKLSKGTADAKIVTEKIIEKLKA